MKKIDLDFHKGGARGSTAVGLSLLLTGLLLVTWIVDIHNNIKTEQNRLGYKLEQQNVNSQKSPSGKADQGTVQQLQRAASVIEQLSFPWAKLFQAIEESTGQDMALLSIQPDITARIVVLDAEAKDWSGMVSYLKRLEENPFFSDVHLVSHQTQQSDPQHPVRFKLKCAWSNASLDAATPAVGLGQP